jgi:hypothetical protein
MTNLFYAGQTTIEKAEKDKAEGKSPGTQAGEFVHGYKLERPSTGKL